MCIRDRYGIDPVHFGIIMMTIVTMGCSTPPVGVALYTSFGKNTQIARVAIMATNSGMEYFVVSSTEQSIICLLYTSKIRSCQSMKKESVLNSTHNLYKTIINASYDCFCVTDSTGHYIVANQAALDSMQLKEEEVLGKTPYDLMRCV